MGPICGMARMGSVGLRALGISERTWNLHEFLDLRRSESDPVLARRNRTRQIRGFRWAQQFARNYRSAGSCAVENRSPVFRSYFETWAPESDAEDRLPYSCLVGADRADRARNRGETRSHRHHLFDPLGADDPAAIPCSFLQEQLTYWRGRSRSQSASTPIGVHYEPVQIGRLAIPDGPVRLRHTDGREYSLLEQSADVRLRRAAQTCGHRPIQRDRKPGPVSVSRNRPSSQAAYRGSLFLVGVLNIG
jgi:hypothetical protein